MIAYRGPFEPVAYNGKTLMEGVTMITDGPLGCLGIKVDLQRLPRGQISLHENLLHLHYSTKLTSMLEGWVRKLPPDVDLYAGSTEPITYLGPTS